VRRAERSHSREKGTENGVIIGNIWDTKKGANKEAHWGVQKETGRGEGYQTRGNAFDQT